MPYGEEGAYKAQAKLKGQSPTPKKVGFGMRYQKDPSAFPFKSAPTKFSASGGTIGTVQGAANRGNRGGFFQNIFEKFRNRAGKVKPNPPSNSEE